jgi:CheY-like chemotaxis protein
MKKSLNLLLVEDDAIEVMKFRRVLENFEFKHSFIQKENGEEALSYLSSTEAYPGIILLDLNMSRMNGVEFLKTLKSDPKYKYIPVVILTTSNNQKDILECYKLGIAGYIVKPLKFEKYTECIKNIFSYWSCNELI